MDGDEQIGVLVIRVTTWRWREGSFWGRRWGNPQELPEWALSCVGPTQQQLPSFDDGTISADELDEELADWSERIFRLWGRRFSLAWLGEEEADAPHEEHGWTIDRSPLPSPRRNWGRRTRLDAEGRAPTAKGQVTRERIFGGLLARLDEQAG